MYRAFTFILLSELNSESATFNGVISQDQVSLMINSDLKMINNEFFYKNKKCDLRTNLVNKYVSVIAQVPELRDHVCKIQKTQKNREQMSHLFRNVSSYRRKSRG